ncbi:MAG: Glucose 1-dehydrogenase [Pseudomonas sp.]|nr:MAG: Glucose 1-dehydrogenase [Pseudomonas sp.]
MARILITGSSDGLGQMAAQQLVNEGHRVVLHARNEARAAYAIAQVPGAEAVLHADLSSIEATCALAANINALGEFDAIIHNAGVGFEEPVRVATVDGLPHVFAVNALAPYLLTALVKRPSRLVYISSRMHYCADVSLQDLAWEQRQWNGTRAYSDSKLHNVLLALAVARRWPDVLSNSLEPGWVSTKLGGAGATDDLELAPRTQAWLAAGTARDSYVTGGYFYHQRATAPLKAALDVELQERFLARCEQFSGVALPLH